MLFTSARHPSEFPFFVDDLVRVSTRHETQDMQHLATTLIPLPHDAELTSRIWLRREQRLLMATMMHLRNMSTVALDLQRLGHFFQDQGHLLVSLRIETVPQDARSAFQELAQRSDARTLIASLRTRLEPFVTRNAYLKRIERDASFAQVNAQLLLLPR